jgi:hypothetical protein
MKTLNTLAHPLIIFLLCIPLMQLSVLLPTQLIVFVSFCCWALYFLLGANLKSGLWGGLCFILGEIFAVAIIVIFLATPGLGNWSLTFAVALCAGLIILLAEQVKAISAVPAYFIGAGLYFAAYFYWWPTTNPANPQGYFLPLVLVAFSMAVGFCLGWLTILLYGWWGEYAKKLEKPEAAQASATD